MGVFLAFSSGRKTFVFLWITIISFLGSTLLIGVYLGFDLSTKLQREYSAQSRFVRKIKRGFGAAFLQDRPNHITFPTHKLNLNLTEYFVPLEFKNGAGGISNDDSSGIVITDLEGKIFRFWDGRIEQLAVKTPNSNVQILKQQLESGQLGNTEINFGHFRYNDVLFHRAGERSFLLISYSEWQAEGGCFTSTLAKTLLPESDPSEWKIGEEDWEIVARTRPCLPLFETGYGVRGAEAGGRLISRSETEVLWSSGVYSRDDNFDKTKPEESLSQNDDTDYGKVLLIDIDRHTVTVLAKGLRNPQGIDIDIDGNPLVTDHGMRGGDELNIARVGANFGFPYVTLSTKYSKEPGGLHSFHTGHDGFVKPIVAFTPSIAPSSVLSVRNFHPDWNGDILIGGLKRQLHRVYMEDGQVLFVEPMDLGYKIRDLVQTDDGQIVIFTNDNKLVFMAPENAAAPNEQFQNLLAAEPDLELRETTQSVFGSCLQCHGLEENENGAGPTLYRVCNRKPETAKFSQYSGALSQAVQIWDQTNLVRFISDPAGTAPGTSMDMGGVNRPEVAELLVKNLCELDH